MSTDFCETKKSGAISINTISHKTKQKYKTETKIAPK